MGKEKPSSETRIEVIGIVIIFIILFVGSYFIIK
jgi:hypothetical protein